LQFAKDLGRCLAVRAIGVQKLHQHYVPFCLLSSVFLPAGSSIVSSPAGRGTGGLAEATKLSAMGSTAISCLRIMSFSFFRFAMEGGLQPAIGFSQSL
jgi:hypothetical protein